MALAILQIITVKLNPGAYRIFFPIILCSFLGAPVAEGSWMIAPQFAWTTLGFQPIEQEHTDNLYGYTLGLSGGYAPARLFEVNAFARYTQLQLRTAALFAGDTTKLHYGAKFGLRFWGVVYLGMSVGPLNYSLAETHSEASLSGRWEGLGYGIAIGGYHQIRDGALLRVTLDFVQAEMQHLAASPELDRSLNYLMINLSCVFDQGGTIQAIDGFFNDTVGRFFR